MEIEQPKRFKSVVLVDTGDLQEIYRNVEDMAYCCSTRDVFYKERINNIMNILKEYKKK